MIKIIHMIYLFKKLEYNLNLLLLKFKKNIDRISNHGSLTKKRPPSIVKNSPVINDDCSDAKKSIAFATSSPVPHLPNGSVTVV
jgi:hypothetical protein